MRQFSQLLDGLVYTRSRNGKLDLIARYMREAPDPDRGWALAALTGNLDLKAVKASAIGAMIRDRTDPVLFEMSRDYVGDLAETVALLWPRREGVPPETDDGALTLAAAVERLSSVSRAAAPQALADMMDHLDASGRFALLKLATGGLRVGISARLAKTGVAQAFGLDVDDVEQVWHALAPPYAALFDWAEGAAAAPTRRVRLSSAPSCWPIRWRPTASTSMSMPPNGNGTASASRSSAQAAKRASTAGVATTSAAASRTLPVPSSATRCSMANCWSAANFRGLTNMAGPPPASTPCNSALAAKPSARR
jgi:hypothetical protein